MDGRKDRLHGSQQANSEVKPAALPANASVYCVTLALGYVRDEVALEGLPGGDGEKEGRCNYYKE